MEETIDLLKSSCRRFATKVRTFYCMFFFYALISSSANGQCSGNIYDPGGPSSNYGNSQDVSTTYTAPIGSVMELSFSQLDLENNYDFIYLYDGANTSAPLMYRLTGNTLPQVITSTGREITLRFTSDGSITTAGYAASLNCYSIQECSDFVTDGLIARYDFKEGSNDIVHDVSGYGTPLNLTIQDPANVSWQADCGVEINTQTKINSTVPASKIISELKSSNALTIEAWVQPANITQDGPARIVSISSSTSQRNITLGQNDDEYAARMRTSDGSISNNGLPQIDGGSVDISQPQHVVLTWDGSTSAYRIYVDGALAYDGTRNGNLSNWNDNYELIIGNESTNNRAWLGKIYSVNIYKKALTSNEITQNLFSGQCCSGNENLQAIYECDEGVEIDMLFTGIKNDLPKTLEFNNINDIDSVLVEIVYKIGNPGTTISVEDADGNSYSADREPIGSNAYLYTFHLPSTTSVTYANTSNIDRAQSLVAYVYRSNQPGASYASKFVAIGGFNNTKYINVTLPQRTEVQDINLSIPVSEVTYDNRILNFTATAGTATEYVSKQWGSNGLGFPDGCCVDTVYMTLKDVPSDALNLVIEIESPPGAGQSYVIAGIVYAEIECFDKEICDDNIDNDNDGDVDCDDIDCGFISNVEFDNGLVDWSLQTSNSTSATLSLDKSWMLSGGNSAYVDIAAINSEDWHIQLVNSGHSVEAGKTYEIFFDARAEANKTISVNTQLNSSPWTLVSGQSFDITTEAQSFSYTFTSDYTFTDNVKLFISLAGSTTNIWIDKVQFKEACLICEAVAGPDQSQCQNAIFDVEANTPTGAIGTWSVISGSATPLNGWNANVNTFTIPIGTTVLRWTVTNGADCTVSDDITLINTNTCDVSCDAALNINGDLEDEGNATNFDLDFNSYPALLIDGDNNPAGWEQRYGTNPSTTLFNGAFYVNTTYSNSGNHMIYLKGNDFCLSALNTNVGLACGKTYKFSLYAAAYTHTGIQGDAPFAIEFIANSDSGTPPLYYVNKSVLAPASNSITDLNWQRYEIEIVMPENGYTNGDFFFTSKDNTHGIFIDDVCIEEIFEGANADAGADISGCDDTFALSANTPPTGYSGSWSTVSGTINFDSNLPNTIATITSGTVATARWTVTDGNCEDYDDIVLSYDNLPALTPTDGEFCPGGSTTLSVSGCTGELLWSNGETTSTITVSPASTQTYTVTCTEQQSSNLINNGDFESTTDLDAWSDWDNSSITTVASEVHSGAKAVKIDASSSWAGIAQDIVVTPGENLTLSLWAKTTNSNSISSVEFVFLDSSYDNIDPTHSVIIENNTYSEYSISGIAPMNAAYLRIIGSTSPTSVMFMDDVSITKGTGCIRTVDVTATQLTPQELDIANDGPLTCDKTTVTITLTDGSKPLHPNFSFLWESGNTNSTEVVSSAGTYLVTVTDPNGCTSIASTMVSENITPPNATTTIPAVITCDNPSASITASPSGLEYLWSTGETTRTININTGGYYTVTVTGINGCEDIATVQAIEDTTPPSVTIPNAEICENGTVILTPSICEYYPTIEAKRLLPKNGFANIYGTDRSPLIGDGEFCFTVDSLYRNSAQMIGVNADPNSSNNYTNIDYQFYIRPITTTNNYRVEIRENQNRLQTIIYPESYVGSEFCIKRTGTLIEYFKDGELQYTSTKLSTQNLYYDHSIHSSSNNTWKDGYSKINNISICGDIELEYSWNTGETTKEIEVSTPGTYTLEVTDAKGCVTTQSVEVLLIDNPTITPTSSGDLSCNDKYIAIDADIEFGIPQMWNTAGTIHTDSDPSCGIKYIDVTGISDNSLVNQTITSGITANEDYEFNFKYKNGGASNVSAGIIAYDNSGIELGSTNQTLNAAANWTDQSLTFTAPTGTVSLEVYFSVKNGANAQFDCTELIVTGSTTNLISDPSFEVESPYTWTGPAGSLVGYGKVIYVDTPGEYEVSATDPITGCTGIGTVMVTQDSTSPPGSISNDGPLTCNEETVTMTAFPSDLIYLWDDNSTNQTRTISEAGIYYVTITASNGCQSTASTTVTSSDLPEVEFTGDNEICLGETTTLSPTIGGSWVSSNTDVAIVSSNGNVVSVGSGTASFTFTESATGCESTIAELLVVNPDLSVSIGNNGSICIQDGSQLTAIPTGGSPEYSYAWRLPDNTTASGEVLDITLNGNYYLTVTDGAGCTAETSGFIYAEYEPFIFTLSTDICEGEDVSLEVNSNTAVSYAWSTNAGSSISPSVTVTPAPPSTTYYVTVTNNLGCSTTASATITVKEKTDVSVSGPATICVGTTTQLEPSTGGTWSSTNVAVATVSNTGVVTGLSDGSASFIFQDNITSCSSDPTTSITVVDKTPVSITGSNILCEDETTTLSPTSGGTWTSGNTDIATVTDDGIVTAVSAGNVKFIFTNNTTNCASDSTNTITIYPKPEVNITGPTALCIGNQTFLTPTSGGSWSSSDSDIATITPFGVVTAIASGDVTFTYTNEYNCASEESATINISDTQITEITGQSIICAEETVQLSANLAGGTWSSSNTGIATVSNTGLVTNLTSGEVTITYSLGTGNCGEDATFEIIAIENPTANLDGSISICVDEISSVTTSSAGGSWSSTDPLVAIVSNTGVVVGISEGTAAFVYTAANGCESDTTAFITVHPSMDLSIDLSGSLCLEENTTLTANPTGGTLDYEYLWTGPGGFTSTADMIDILINGSYTLVVTDSKGCSAEESIYIYEQYDPFIFTLNTDVCEGESVTLSVNASGDAQYAWSTNANNSDQQTVTVVPTTPSSAYTVTVTNNNGCSTEATAEIDVNAKPVVAITGDQAICEGFTTTLSPTTGGFWTSSDYSVATVSNDGVVTGISTGSATFTFRNETTGCISDPTLAIAVENNAPVSITGDAQLCVGVPYTLTASVAGGAWSSSNPSILSIDEATGEVTPITQGIAEVSYLPAGPSCFDIGTKTINVNNTPTVNIVGPNTICAGENTNLIPSNGGSWASSDESIATVSSIGIVTGHSGGQATFTFTSEFGCVRQLSTPIIIIDNPEVELLGPDNICINETTSLSPTSGGIWISSNNSVASINSSGIVTGKQAGTAEFTFIEITNGCSSENAITITVGEKPSISGLNDPIICRGTSTSISPSTGGTWESSNPAIASITDEGIITGVSSGNAYFTFTNATTGCTSDASSMISVNELPSVNIVGPAVLCIGETSQLIPSTGGTWSSSDVSVATISNSGVVTAVSAGTVNFAYTNSTTNCTSESSDNFTVSNPESATITSPARICVNETTVFAGSNPGTWSSSNPLIGSIDGNGNFVANAPGNVTITLTTNAYCIENPSVNIFIDALPVSEFTGSNNLCIGSTTTLSPSTNGTWTSSNNAVATVTDEGIVTAISNGSAAFTFTSDDSGCTSTTTNSLVVYSKPVIQIAGDTEICIGNSTNMSPATGGSWISTNTNVAIISTNGIVTAVSEGTATFIFTETGSGCVSDESAPITVKPQPNITLLGDNTLCIGETTNFSPSTGGNWLSDNPLVATITNDGIVTAVSQGVTRFTFISNDGCISNSSSPIVVFGAETPIIDGPSEICIGDNLQMQPSTGGTWSSSDNSIATIENNGIVTAIEAGIVKFTFIDDNTGCTSIPSENVTINETPTTTLIGPADICIGGITNLVPSSGGVWVSLSPDIATIANNGEVTGITEGNASFVFTSLSSGCSSEASVSISVGAPSGPEYFGDTNICIGDTSYISPETGVIWESSNPNIATISNTGMIIGVAQGTVNFRYSEVSTGCLSEYSESLIVNGVSSVSISGPPSICIGSTTQLSPSTGGSWVSLQPSIATITNSGLVTGLASGNAYFEFTDDATGCKSDGSLFVTVQNGTTVSITGSSDICVGYTTTMSPNSGGFWTSNNPQIASITNAGIVTAKVPGKATFKFTDAITGCVTDATDQIITISDCKNHDFNVTMVNQTVNGNVSTNDNLPVGFIYSGNTQLISKPQGSLATLTVNSDGTYSFISNKPGDYYYNIPICETGQFSGCPTTLLEITVLDNVFTEGNPAINLEISTTYGSTNIITPGTPISVDLISNDKCVYTGGCTLDYENMTVTDGPSNGTITMDVDRNMTYTPNRGFIGYDTIYYEICSIDSGKCNESLQIVAVKDASANNSLTAADDFNYTIAGVSANGNVLDNDTDPENDVLSITPQGSLLVPITTPDGSYYIESNGEYSFTPNPGFSGNTEIIYTLCDDNTNSECTDATIHILVFDDIQLNIRVYLEGALRNNGNEIGSHGRPLMRDNLRVNPFDGGNSIPLQDPYTVPFNNFIILDSMFNQVGPHLYVENQTISDSTRVFSIEGENAIVDWIHIELRSKNDKTHPIATRAGLLQRDGDVVDLDGVSPLRFQGVNIDSCYVIAKHRNHLAVMSEKIHFSELVDFTSIDYPVFNYGTTKYPGVNYTGLSTKNTVKNGYRACWAGDADANGRIKFTAPDDDINVILTEVLFSSPLLLINYDEAIGYFSGDYDLNGKVKYTNPDDDQNLLFGQVILFPTNNSFISNYNLIIEQVPDRQ